MRTEMRFSRRSLIIAGTTLPWLALPVDAAPAVAALNLSHLPAYAREAAHALNALTEPERAMLEDLADRCLAALPAHDPKEAVAALNKLAREDFIAGRTLLAGGWLISVTEAAVFTRLASQPGAATSLGGAG